MKEFKLNSPYKPLGDQPKAINSLVKGINDGVKEQTLLGVTGSGKTFTMANIIEKVQKPTLIISHNKTLAAQLYEEFKEFFPDNAVEYFVSYYDYYQPEAYVPRTDTFIDKESSVNEDIDIMRHSATQSLLSRDDVIVISSVSCIYGVGSPEDYGEFAFGIAVGDTYERSEILARLVFMQYERNDIEFARGQFRVRGDVIEINPVHGTPPIRIELFGDEIDAISLIDRVTGKKQESLNRYMIFPAKHFVVGQDKMGEALSKITNELDERLSELKAMGKLLEAQRLEQRTRFDIEMLKEMGYCTGVENYSMHLSGRNWGDKPYSLLQYFPDDFLTIIDESHVTVPQIRGMYNGDRARKETLVDYGFRLPSAKENRPLRFEEFESSVNQVIYVSATPAAYELAKSRNVVEQIIRPTGLVDPEVIIRPVADQVEDLLKEVQETVKKDERILVTTLTKRMAEDLTDYYARIGVKVRYMHSEIDTLERIEIIDDLRRGKFDVLVGVNLLREGLDLPEVSLVAILDADKEGFLRNETSLIQTIGRAARNVNGRVIMYADEKTDSVMNAYNTTVKRRKLQMKYNEVHGITPTSAQRTLKEKLSQEDEKYKGIKGTDISKMPKDELRLLIKDIEKDMKEAASRLDFERAAELRNKLYALKGMDK
ncbi:MULTISPECIES: excinuclease ABC subunit UvrB [Methanobrevibacter]|uniref:excinuclease ABC subunit UvrB n=1 Tax=Methanobrevibacter TaxID=2172 RepID=UPI0025EAA515|nr:MULTISPECIES: excinuclease ABC subunit UvrB [Methanobrevibacter]MBS7258205.1 excinuclease ABC subunit UvrB [Methanobrevibacter sp.]MCI7429105.1 excinuclease ABC subunit UvrB [Methanobrevibacter sp.]MDD6775879.1 excinuclease ABC subunit UvrB [Methanobacteriaceae archaeon]MDY3097505.1 excinuclease ABC subunit UvrB [Methanobrevibacter sp.]